MRFVVSTTQSTRRHYLVKPPSHVRYDDRKSELRVFYELLPDSYRKRVVLVTTSLVYPPALMPDDFNCRFIVALTHRSTLRKIDVCVKSYSRV